MEQYIGPKKVKKIDGATVYFEDGTDETYSERSLTFLLSEEAIGESDLARKFQTEMAQAALDLFMEFNPRFSDINPTFLIIQDSFDAYQNRTICKAAGVIDKFDGNPEIQLRNVRLHAIRDYLSQKKS